MKEQPKYILDKDYEYSDMELAAGIILRTECNGKTLYIPPITIGDADEYMQDFALCISSLGYELAKPILRGKSDTAQAVKALQNKQFLKVYMRFIKKWALKRYNPEKVNKKDLLKMTPYSFLSILEKHKKVNFDSVKKKAAQMSARRRRLTQPTPDISTSDAHKNTAGATPNSQPLPSPV